MGRAMTKDNHFREVYIVEIENEIEMVPYIPRPILLCLFVFYLFDLQNVVSL